jgi:hypothetical protein
MGTSSSSSSYAQPTDFPPIGSRGQPHRRAKDTKLANNKLTYDSLGNPTVPDLPTTSKRSNSDDSDCNTRSRDNYDGIDTSSLDDSPFPKSQHKEPVEQQLSEQQRAFLVIPAHIYDHTDSSVKDDDPSGVLRETAAQETYLMALLTDRASIVADT